MDEFDDRRIGDRVIAHVSAEPCGHEEERRSDALSAAGLNVTTDLRNQLDARLDVARKLGLDSLEVVLDRFEKFRLG